MMPPPPQVKERCDALEIQIRWNEYMDFDVRTYTYVCICVYVQDTICKVLYGKRIRHLSSFYLLIFVFIDFKCMVRVLYTHEM